MNRKSSPRTGAAPKPEKPPKGPAAGSKNPPAAPKSSPASTCADPGNLRAQIDRLDQELVKLLNRRAEIAHQIGQVKNQQGLEVWSAAREDEVIAQAVAASEAPCRRRPSASSFAS